MDEMNDFEQRLKALPVRGHSADLKQRVFGPHPRQSGRVVEVWRRPIRLGWAALFAVAAGAAGFSANHLWAVHRGPAAGQDVRVEVRIVKADAEGHDFDLTNGDSGFLFGDVSLEVEKNMEVGG
jgi:hypothetical protein